MKSITASSVKVNMLLQSRVQLAVWEFSGVCNMLVAPDHSVYDMLAAGFDWVQLKSEINCKHGTMYSWLHSANDCTLRIKKEEEETNISCEGT